MTTIDPSLTDVGPGSTLGQFLRAHWLPFLPAADLAHGAERPVRVQLLGERLVAFRSGQNEVGLIDALCPHAHADMFWGVIEDDGLRCTYHGWKFAPNGACIDTPMHGPGRGYDTRSFPVVERGSLLWTHLGRPAESSEPPALSWEGKASAQRVSKSFVQVAAELLSRAASSDVVEAKATEDGLELLHADGLVVRFTLPGLISVNGFAVAHVIPADKPATIVLTLGADVAESDSPSEEKVQRVGQALVERLGRALADTESP